MTLTNYSARSLSPKRQDAQPAVSTTVPQVVEEVRVVRRPSEAPRSDLLVPTDDWGWEELRDYVVARIEEIHGAFPRDFRKETGIFKRFMSTYGQAAPLIAQYVFEVKDGRWKGAPVSVNRFCKASDPFFAEPILAFLTSD